MFHGKMLQGGKTLANYKKTRVKFKKNAKCRQYLTTIKVLSHEFAMLIFKIFSAFSIQVFINLKNIFPIRFMILTFLMCKICLNFEYYCIDKFHYLKNFYRIIQNISSLFVDSSNFCITSQGKIKFV